MATPAPKTVLIAGCGDLGTEVGLRFQALGHRVVGVRQRSDLLPSGFERQSVDLRNHPPVIPDRLSVVVIALTAPARSEDEYRRTYVGGVRNVLSAITASGQSPRVIFVSSTAVYGVNEGTWVDESTPATGPSSTSAVLVEAENLVVAAALESCVLRLGGIYGPGRERLIDQVRSGTARIPSASTFTNRIHRDDAAQAIVHLASRQAEMPAVVIGVDEEPAELGDVLRFLAEELQLPAPPQEPTDSAGAASRRLSSSLLRSTGFRFAYPSYREGYRSVLEGVQSRHP
jgi:nucleoside-diphosphate-sugar epimerase